MRHGKEGDEGGLQVSFSLQTLFLPSIVRCSVGRAWQEVALATWRSGICARSIPSSFCQCLSLAQHPFQPRVMSPALMLPPLPYLAAPYYSLLGEQGGDFQRLHALLRVRDYPAQGSDALPRVPRGGEVCLSARPPRCQAPVGPHPLPRRTVSFWRNFFRTLAVYVQPENVDAVPRGTSLALPYPSQITNVKSAYRMRR